MHVLQVTPRYFPNIGGVGIVVQKISEMLVTRGVKATVYTVDLSPTLPRLQNVNGVVVKRFSPVLGDPFYVPELKFATSLRREQADILHVHNVHTLLPFIVALCKRRTQKLLLQPHYHRFGQSALRYSLLRLYRYGLGNVFSPLIEAIIANSAYENRIIREDFPKFKKVFMIPEGMDVDEVKRVKHNPVKPKRILYVGALRRYKNVDKILEGFAHLIKAGDTQYRLVTVGEGTEYASLVNLAHNLGISSFVEWKSDLSREQLLCEYEKASVFILLSPLESFSRVVYEALLIGVPVVALNFGALSNLVEAGLAEGVNSLNPSEIADAIVNATRKTYTKISDNSNAFLDWEEYSNRIMNVYCELLEMQNSLDFEEDLREKVIDRSFL
jgi:glycosyltransferase involved in cell wall biosynthesis